MGKHPTHALLIYQAPEFSRVRANSHPALRARANLGGLHVLPLLREGDLPIWPSPGLRHAQSTEKCPRGLID